MPTQNFLNPFDNSIFLGLLGRLILLFVGSLSLLLLLARGNTDRLFRSNVGARFIGWLLLAPLYVLGVFAGRLPGLVVLLGFMAAAVYEFSHIAKLPWAFAGALYLLAVWTIIIGAFAPQYFYSLPLVYFLVASALAIRSNNPKYALVGASLTVYGAIWFLFGLGHVLLLSRFNNTIDNHRSLLFLAIFATGLADIGGYVFGKLFERLHILTNLKVANKISPNKTYAGTLGYIVGAGAAIWILRFSLPAGLSNWKLAGAAVLIGCFSFMGGLTHSYFKRYYGVKDSSNLIPGHGGVMDRIDSLTRVLVVIYYYFLLVLR